jgi:hypothetical protein
MKQLFLVLALAFSINTYAQEDKTVTLVVSGQGKTQDEARQNALRSAIEQAYGAFISSKTEILNDDLVKDEIVAVANGNIKKYDVVSTNYTPSSDYSITINATVSISKLTDFVEKRGFVIELQGGLFAENIKLQKLYEANELIALDQICTAAKKMFLQSFDYDLNVSQPVASKNNTELFEMKMSVDVNINKNYSTSAEYVSKSLQALNCSKETIRDYQQLKKELLHITFVDFRGTSLNITLRNVQGKMKLIDLFNHIRSCTYNFEIESNVEKVNSNKKLADLNQLFNNKDNRNSWFLYAGKINPGKIAYQRAYFINLGYPQVGKLNVYYSRYSGIYALTNYTSETKFFPLCFEGTEVQTARADYLVLSLYNPFGKYVTTHAIIHTANLEVIEKTTEYKVVLFD